MNPIRWIVDHPLQWIVTTAIGIVASAVLFTLGFVALAAVMWRRGLDEEDAERYMGHP